MSRRAFTLVELLVVISIIGLLSSIAVVSLSSARVKARDTRRQADVKQIVTAMQLYYDTNGTYPDASGALGCACGNFTTLGACCLGYNDSTSCWAGAGKGCTALTNAMQPYMAKIPTDPEHTAGFYGDTYLYLDTSVTGWVTTGPALHWLYEQVSNSTNCLGGVFGFEGGGYGRNRYYCALTLRP